MGLIYQAECTCGYKSGDLFVGLGKLGSASQRDLAHCANCHNLVWVRSAGGAQPCPNCGHEVQIVRLNDEAHHKSGLESLALRCPRCGNLTVKLHELGIWD